MLDSYSCIFSYIVYYLMLKLTGTTPDVQLILTCRWNISVNLKTMFYYLMLLNRAKLKNM